MPVLPIYGHVGIPHVVERMDTVVRGSKVEETGFIINRTVIRTSLISVMSEIDSISHAAVVSMITCFLDSVVLLRQTVQHRRPVLHSMIRIDSLESLV